MLLWHWPMLGFGRPLRLEAWRSIEPVLEVADCWKRV